MNLTNIALGLVLLLSVTFTSIEVLKFCKNINKIKYEPLELSTEKASPVDAIEIVRKNDQKRRQLLEKSRNTLQKKDVKSLHYTP